MTQEKDQEHAAADDASSLPYRRYAERGFRFAHAMLRNVDDAEETVQEAFCRLAAAKQLEPPAFEPRFFRTVRNLAIDRLRQRPHRAHLPLDESALPARAAAPPDDAPLAPRLRRLVADLPAPQRDALLLRVHGGLAYDAIAAALDATTTQVRTWIFRARRKLEDGLRRAEPRP
ncbi:MAG: RNA polymerase sigma factor, partial [Planctomycetota bacterium JB042]